MKKQKIEVEPGESVFWAFTPCCGADAPARVWYRVNQPVEISWSDIIECACGSTFTRMDFVTWEREGLFVLAPDECGNERPHVHSELVKSEMSQGNIPEDYFCFPENNPWSGENESWFCGRTGCRLFGNHVHHKWQLPDWYVFNKDLSCKECGSIDAHTGKCSFRAIDGQIITEHPLIRVSREVFIDKSNLPPK